MGRTITEKILSRVTGDDVSAGDIVYPEPELITIHDWYVVNFDRALAELGVDRLYDADKVLICTDHEPVAVSPQATERQKKVREIVCEVRHHAFLRRGKRRTRPRVSRRDGVRQARHVRRSL